MSVKTQNRTDNMGGHMKHRKKYDGGFMEIFEHFYHFCGQWNELWNCL